MELLSKIIYLILFVVVTCNLHGQNGIIGSGFGTNDWSTTNCWSDGANGTRIFTATANGTGNQYFRLVTCWDGAYNQWGPASTTVDYQVNINSVVISSEVIQNNMSKAYYINVTNTLHNYIFKSRGGGKPPLEPSFVVFCVQGNIATINSVSCPSAVIPGSTVEITAVLNTSLSTGQGVYLRYTTDNWSSSTIVEMNGSDFTFTANIPSAANVKDQVVKYYVFTSGNELSISHNDVDFFTINNNNNSGSNYQYTPRAIEWVSLHAPSGGTMMPGGDFNIYSMVYINGITDQNPESVDIDAWIGYNTTNTDPATWDESVWKTAGFNVKSGNNHEYINNAKDAGLTAGTYYYASRFKYGNSSYYYGGYNSIDGNFWDGVDYVSGVLRFGKNSTLTGNWEDNSSWDGGVPLPGEHVFIKNGNIITINTNVSVNSVTIENGGTLVMNGAVSLTIEENGTWTNNGSFNAGNGAIILQTKVSTGGTSLTEFNNITVSGIDVSFNNSVSVINGVLNITTGSVLNAPRFNPGSTLKYSQGGTYTRVTEWNNPWHVVVANNTILDLNITHFGGDITVLGNLTVENGSTVDMNNYVNYLIINGALNLYGNIVLSSEAGGDLMIKGNLDIAAGSSFNFNSRAVFFVGTLEQQIIDGAGVIFPYIIVDNLAGVTANNNLTVSNKLTLSNGLLNMQLNTLTIGFDDTNTGEIEATSGSVTGRLRRWFGASTNSTDVSAIFPVSLDGYRRKVGVYFTVAPTTGGTIEAEIFDKTNMPVDISDDYNKGLSILNCDGVEVDNIYENCIWKLTNNGITGGEYTVKFNTHGINVIETPANLRMVKKNSVADDWIYQGTASVNTVNADTYEYWVQQAGLTTFSYFALGGFFSENPLPIELLNFEGKQLSNNVILEWQTASETNNHYFKILRANESLQFNSIGTIMAVGNSSLNKNYSFIDSYPFEPYNYYKLRQFDIDGAYSDSPIIHVGFKPDKIIVTKVNEIIKINFPFRAQQVVYYQIFNIDGMVTQKGTLMVKPDKLVEIQLGSYTDKIFFISLSGNFNPVTFKIYNN